VSRRYVFLAVEGPTDEAVVARAFIKLLGFKKFAGRSAELDAVWRCLVPTYPAKSGNLYGRLPMPSILFSDACSVAVYAGGGSNLIPHVVGLLDNNHDLHQMLAAFGVIADADKKPPEAVAAKYRAGFRELFPGFPDRPGEVVAGPPALGVFVLPDNARQGVVEHLVIECGDHVYPTHMERAQRYVRDFVASDPATATKWDPFDEQKAVIASVASLLRPGKTNAVTIEDNLWLSDETKHLPKLAELLRFLRELVPAPRGIVPPGPH
jgi:hypothetical protein